MITFKCPNCYTEYVVHNKYSELVKDKQDCKFCVRKDPNILTTAEMDGLFTQEDMRNRSKVVFQCTACNKWTPHTWHTGANNKYLPCANCGEVAYDAGSIKSLRTYNPTTDNKRRAAKRKR